MAYVYRHIRLDKNEPFYIGIGEDKIEQEYKYKRAYNQRKRNQYWKNIISKTSYKVEILEEDLSWEEACKKEIWWISFYGRADLGKGPLVNMTDGGDGTRGYLTTNETRKKLSVSGLGRKMPHELYTEEHRYKLGSSLRNKRLTKEHIEKIRRTSIGRKHTEESIDKMKGRKFSNESIEKMRIAAKERYRKKDKLI